MNGTFSTYGLKFDPNYELITRKYPKVLELLSSIGGAAILVLNVIRFLFNIIASKFAYSEYFLFLKFL